MYFLGIEAERGTARRRAGVGAPGAARGRPPSRPGSWPCSSSPGVFTNFFTSWLVANAKYVTVRDRRRPRRARRGDAVRVPAAASPRRRRRSAAATARCGRCSCTASPMPWPRSAARIGLFVATAVRRRRTASSPAWSTSSPTALGMALSSPRLTVSLAVANQALLRVLRSAMRYVDLLAAAFVLLSGVYLSILLGRRRERGLGRRSPTPSSGSRTRHDAAQRQLGAGRRRARRRRRRRWSSCGGAVDGATSGSPTGAGPSVGPAGSVATALTRRHPSPLSQRRP